eukprot:gene5230-5292_t
MQRFDRPVGSVATAAEVELYKKNLDFGKRDRDTIAPPDPPLAPRDPTLNEGNAEDACQYHALDYAQLRPRIGMWLCCKAQDISAPGCKATAHIATRVPASHLVPALARWRQQDL